MSKRKIRVVVVVTAVMAMLAGACASSDDGALGGGSNGDSGDRPGSLDGSEPRTPEDQDATVDAALEDVQVFWRETYPEVFGSEWPEIEGGFHPYDREIVESGGIPDCGPYPTDYEDIAQNAFYCEDGDFIAWDTDEEEGLLPWLWEDFGPYTIAIVMAHEFGHAVQARIGELEFTPDAAVRVEMQADCFAGAFTAWVAEGNSEAFGLDETMLDESIAGMIAIRDEPGTPRDTQWSHGSGVDRVRAFQEGYEDGVERCSEYPDEDRAGQLTILQDEFSDFEESESAGNVPVEEMFEISTGSLEIWFDAVFANDLGADTEWTPLEELQVVDPASDEVTCGGETVSGGDLEWVSHYCVDENVAIIDVNLVDHLYQTGDFAVASEIARLWAVAAQEQLGIDSSVEASLQADCMTGSWAASFWVREGETSNAYAGVDDDLAGVRLSPGDLDESIIGMLSFGEQSDEIGTVFDRTSALRTGFFEGLAECEEFHSFG